MKTIWKAAALGAAIVLFAGCSMTDKDEAAEEMNAHSHHEKMAASQPKPEQLVPGMDGFRAAFSIDKAKLADRGSGKYMVLQPGYKLIYTAGPGNDLVVTVLDKTETVDGVKCRIIEEKETDNNKLAEISRNFYAIDKSTGDIYYFGEEVDIYDDQGKIISHDGAWKSGENGARFGLFVPGAPKVGEKFYQEVAPGVALDRVEVKSVSEKITVPAGTFENCLKTEETTPLEPTDIAPKIYAPEIGLIVDSEFQLAKKEMGLPEAVAAAFKAAFPNGVQEKLDLDEENNVWVYDFEFKNGDAEQECDIAADGTLIEVTLVVGEKDVPAPVMAAVEKVRDGADFERIEKIDISYDIVDGKCEKLAAPVTQYSFELKKDGKSHEVTFQSDGTPVAEPPAGAVMDTADGSYRVPLDKLPPAVRAQFEKQAQGWPIRGISLEINHGVAIYDCDVFISGKKHEVVVDADGNLKSKPLPISPKPADK